MASFEILPWQITAANAEHRVQVTIRLPQGDRSFEIIFPDAIGPLGQPEVADGLFTLLLFSAMHQGLPLHFPMPLSRQLLKIQARQQEIAAAWFPSLRRVEVAATPREGPADAVLPSRRTAATFTAGVDSMLTALENRDSLDFLFYMQGFGPLTELEGPIFQPMASHMKKVADKLGRPFHVGRMTYRALADICAPWMDNHGAALASLGLFMGNSVERLLIPSSNPWEHQSPWGSHHLLDESWSSERVSIQLHGSRFNRPHKVQHLVNHYPDFVGDLAVCWTDDVPNQARNCSRCEKCLRTMCSLAMCGWERWGEAFCEPLNLERVRALKLQPGNLRNEWEPMLRFGKEHAPDHPVTTAVEVVVANARLRIFLAELQKIEGDWHRIPSLVKLAHWWRDEVWQSWSDRQRGWLRKKIKGLATTQPASVIRALWGKDAL